MLEKIKEIIIEQLNLQGVEITEETSFKDDLGADSLDLFELVMAFEGISVLFSFWDGAAQGICP